MEEGRRPGRTRQEDSYGPSGSSLQSKQRSHLQPELPCPPLWVRAIGTDLAVVEVHGKSLGKNSGYVP